MEERLSPSEAKEDAAATAPAPDAAEDDTKLSPLPLPPGYETYVVQIPRDNVCRIPPPEHARIVEEHLKKVAATKTQAKRRRRHRFRCSIALPIFLIIVIATIAYVTARYTLFRPVTPAFTVARIRAGNLTAPAAAKGSKSTPRSPLPEFKVSIHAENRNQWMSVSYGGGGAATLAFKDKVIAQGKIPAFINANDDGASNFTVSLAGKGAAALPKSMKDKLNGEQEKFMELTLDLVVEMTSYLRNERMKLQIYCDFRVRNSLTKNAKITSQVCGTGYH